ncbi:polysaccharide deacetylase family protein [Clostridium sp. CMCC3677]|uniref:polysaccharide deacetylase family protein n=1 Tax=Clostridium sp. CMCC3677 TaxID=2949963 RepID=UPI0013F0A01C|nr:polysaccharide deacetylase family protein [Clostridium sp. CMCC3677]NFG62364.1 polysaccharide deacetylase family protein [Clostridium botulinum]NFQ10273.1 polysaccharide deacetylase family protein [Clostridium botulinum]
MKNKKNKILKGLLVIILLLIVSLFTFQIKNNTKGKIVPALETENSDVLESKDIKNPFEGIDVTSEDMGVTVLGYHSIGDEFKKDPLVVSKDLFRTHLQAIKDAGYTTITLHELYDYLYNGAEIPKKSVVITLDDGYKDNYTNAFPILKEFSMNATMFIIGNYLDGDVYLLPSQVKEMSDYGIDIEGHTLTHRELSTLNYDEQLKEVKESKIKLENITGKNINFIAYPSGSYNDETLKAVKEAGYSMAFTVKKGQAHKGDNQYEINRVLVDYTYKPRHIKRDLK